MACQALPPALRRQGFHLALARLAAQPLAPAAPPAAARAARAHAPRALPLARACGVSNDAE
eukprot:5218056-Alexandrium_andersonii.AAC.1